jgi:O-methyltransferase involved in polyketide biosynthesis
MKFDILILLGGLCRLIFYRSGGAKMDSVSKTLYIPLYGKDYVSRKGIILNDPKAEEIWKRRKFQNLKRC